MVTKDIIIKSIDDAIIKCSKDGTTFSKELSKQLEKFTKEYGGLTDHEELSLYESNGDILIHKVGTAHTVGVNLMDYDDYENLHVFHNHPSSFIGKVPTYLSVPDMQHLLLSNNEGKNLLKSVTAVSPNGSSMTVIKTNEFNFSDIDSNNAREVMIKLNKYCREYHDQYTDNVIDYMTEKAIDYQNRTGDTIRASVFEDEAREHVLKEMGTMGSYLKKEGIYDDLKSVGLKVKIKNGKYNIG